MAEAKKKGNDAQAQHRETLAAQHEQNMAAMQEAHDRAMAMLSVPQKVIDGNEAAALQTITGQKPPRDDSDAPEPAVLGAPPAEGKDSLGTPADAETKHAKVS